MKMKWLLDPDGLVCPGKVARGQCLEPARAGARPEAASLDVVWGEACIKLFNVGSLEVIPLIGLPLILHVLTKAAGGGARTRPGEAQDPGVSCDGETAPRQARALCVLHVVKHKDLAVMTK